MTTSQLPAWVSLGLDMMTHQQHIKCFCQFRVCISMKLMGSLLSSGFPWSVQKFRISKFSILKFMGWNVHGASCPDINIYSYLYLQHISTYININLNIYQRISTYPYLQHNIYPCIVCFKYAQNLLDVHRPRFGCCQHF